MPVLPTPVTPYYGGKQVVNPANVIQATTAPGTTFTEDGLGTLWVNYSTGNLYALVQKASGVDTWALISSSSGSIVSVSGTTNQITATTSSGAVTLSIPSAFTAPGSVTATTSLTATLGNITATNGNLALSTIGNHINIKSGTLGFAGSSTLVAGTVTIANTNILTGDIIILTRTAVNASTSLGALTYTISNGASFTVTSAQLATPGSTQTGDLSSFGYFIVRPT